MALDPMLWDVMGLEDNNAKPLSFRYWGAFVCGTPVVDVEIIREAEPPAVAAAMIAALDAMLPRVLARLASEPFSQIAQHPAGPHDNWRMGETITHALRLEGAPALALHYARGQDGAFHNHSSLPDKRVAGKSHTELVIARIEKDSGLRALPRYLRRLFRL